DQVENDRHLVDRHARGRLIEHEDMRLQRHHQGDLELALVAVRQGCGAEVTLVCKRNLFKELLGAVHPVDMAAAAAPQIGGGLALGLDGETDVFDDGQVGKQVGDLKGASDSATSALSGAQAGDVDAIEMDGA